MEKGSFNHSVKVPKIYKCAAKISQEVAGGAGSIKQLVYEKKHFNTKALYALVVTTFQKANDLDLLLKRTKLLERETPLDPWLAKILISELLWGKMQLPKSDAKPILTILAYEQAFRAHLSDSSRDSSSGKSPAPRKPRYIRINTLITPINEALELFQEEGWKLLPPENENTYRSFLERVTNLEGNFFLKDFHIPDLLVFPSGTEFFNHPGYKKGAIILQDKASCLPVHILHPYLGSVVLDMCAAPGMKTTQLAAALQDNGTVYAVERDSKRFEVLKKIVETSGATCVKIINQDVLQCGNSNFPNVEYILVDPSCSGSGMTDRLEINPSLDTFRLQKLAGFQIKILRSALTRYPDARKVVYSTCSLHTEENEDVVRQVLETNNQFKLVPAENFVNKEWANFGSSDFGNIGKYCLYARPSEDLTNGFFLAVFERLEEGENNEFFNGRVLNYRKNIDQKQARKDRKKMINPTDDSLANNLKTNIDYISENNSQAGVETTTDVKVFEKKKPKKDKKETNNQNGQLDKILLLETDVHDQSLENINVDINLCRKKKKKKKYNVELREMSEEPIDTHNDQNEILAQAVKIDKKKKRKNFEGQSGSDVNLDDCGETTLIESIKTKKKKHNEYNDGHIFREPIIVNKFDGKNNVSSSKKLKKDKEEINNQNGQLDKIILIETDVHDQSLENINVDINLCRKKKKKKKHNEELHEMSEEPIDTHNGQNKILAQAVKIDKKKKRKNFEGESSSVVNLDDCGETTLIESIKTKKKKHNEYTDGHTFREPIIVNTFDGKNNVSSSKKLKRKKRTFS